MSEIAFDTIMECLGTLTDDEAMTVVHRMASQFGWAGTFFTREDAAMEWRNQTGNIHDLPEEVWEEIICTWEWRKGIAETLCERGWELVYTAVEDAIEKDKVKP